MGKDHRGGLGRIPRQEISARIAAWRRKVRLRRKQPNRARAGRSSARGVRGLIAHHPAIGQRQTEVVARLQQKSRRGLSAPTYAGVSRGRSFGVVETITEPGEANAAGLQFPNQFCMDGAKLRVTAFTQRVVGLIGNQDQREPGRLQPEQRPGSAFRKVKIVHRERRFHAAGRRIQDEGIENPVAIQENRRYFPDSHFISLRRSRGWVTRR